MRSQDDAVLRRWLNGRRQRHSVRGLNNAEFLGRLNRRRQWHTIRDGAILPANPTCKPVVDRNGDGKYDKTY